MLSTTTGMSCQTLIPDCCSSRIFNKVFKMHVWRRKIREDYGMLTYWW